MKILQVHMTHRRAFTESNGDVWSTAWADDDNLYTVCDDAFGFDHTCSSNLAFNVLTGNTLPELSGRTINPMSAYGDRCETGSDGATWKANGLTCVDGMLYLSVSRHRYGIAPFFIQQTWDASIVASSDYGRTWSPTPELGKPMFPGQVFSTPFFVHYGQDGCGGKDGGEKYLYAVSSDGVWNNGSTMTLGRVHLERLPKLDGRMWEFFQGLESDGLPVWTTHLERAAYIFRSPGCTGMTGIHYIPPLGLYIMPQWYYAYPLDTSGLDWQTAVTTSPTYLELYTAEAPWGPWQCIHSEQFSEGWYNPTIPAKFIGEDGSRFIMFAAGLGGHNHEHYGLNAFEVELTLAR